MTTPTNGDLLPFEHPAIKWWPDASNVFFVIESKKPARAKTFNRFRIECVTADGHPASATRLEFQEQIYEPGTHYRASTQKHGARVNSPLYDSLEAAKDACDHFNTHGTFPK